MGVKGLWTLLEPVGYPISLESLEGKVIAVDISIWLNQSIKGIRDKKGVLAENAHLLGLFNRICKLLFYKIKPVFVFDGGAPALKRQTIEERRLRRDNIMSKVKGSVNKVLKSYLSAKFQKDIEFEEDGEDEGVVNDVVGFGLKEWTAKDEAGMFTLPDDVPFKDEAKTDEEGDEWQEFAYAAHPRLNSYHDPALIDTESEDFKSLPPEIRHEILSEIREKKKRLNKVENIPTETGDFSDYQMKRILIRRKIQEKMEEAEGEMVRSLSAKGAQTLDMDENESYHGITAQRVMSDDATHFILMNKRKMDSEDISKLLLMPKKKKEEPEKKFCPKKAHRDIFCNVSDFDFGIQEEAAKDGASSLRERLRDSRKEGPTLCFELKKNTSSTVPKNPVRQNTIIDSESERDSDSDLVEVEEVDFIDQDYSSTTDEQEQSQSSQIQPQKVHSSQENLQDLTLIDTQSEDFKGLPSDIRDEILSEIRKKKMKLSRADTLSTEISDLVDLTEEEKLTDRESPRSHLKPRKSISPSPSDSSKSQEEPIASTSKAADLRESQPRIITSNCSSILEKSSPTKLPSPSLPPTSSASSSHPKSVPYSPKNAVKNLNPDFDSEIEEIEIQVKDSSTNHEKHEMDTLREEQPTLRRSPHFAHLNQTEPEKGEKSLSSQPSPKRFLETDKVSTQSPKKDEMKSKSPPKSSINSEIANKTPIKSPNKDGNADKTPIISPIKVLRSSERQDSFDEEMKKMKKAERQTSTVAQTMVSDCRDLLSMFGIPYVMSPMEAEAQCAALEIQGLTHGTITDDSDVWLFGGKTVFKNFFNQSKFVEMYSIKDIEEKLKLDRETMICVAMLTGCDYTDGVESVGPVKALEIVSEFPGKGIECLKKFKEWWTQKKGGKDKSPGNKRRAQFLKLTLNETFPSEIVYQAFISPVVLDSKESFSWGIPDLDLLRRYTADKLRWSKEKIDSVLVPIIKKLNEKQSQLRIDQFIKIRSNNNKMAYTSKRLADAVNKISGSGESNVEVCKDRAHIPMSALREKIKNQRKKGRTVGPTKRQPKPNPSTVINKKNDSNKKEPITVQLSESSSESE